MKDVSLVFECVGNDTVTELSAYSVLSYATA